MGTPRQEACHKLTNGAQATYLGGQLLFSGRMWDVQGGFVEVQQPSPLVGMHAFAACRRIVMQLLLLL